MGVPFIQVQSARKPAATDDMCLLYMEYVDAWKRLFTLDYRAKCINEYSAEFSFGKTHETLKGALLSSLQKCAQS